MKRLSLQTPVLLLSCLCVLSTSQPTAPTTAKYNYAEVLHKSFLFYHAQRSGNLSEHRRLAWRSDSCFECRGPNGEDLSGGYYEAANTMKWGLPLAFTITQLAWNVIEFGDAMKSVNEFEEAMDAVKWGADYLINAHPSPNVFYGQFGDSEIDFKYFGPPEEYEMWALGPKPVYALTEEDPGTEIVAQAAAALAATSVAWQPYHPEYAQLCLTHAIQLYQFATNHMRSFMESTQPGFLNHMEWYPSHNGFHDELVLAAIWLYKATNDINYLNDAKARYHAHFNYGGYEYSWDEKVPALHVLLAQINPDNSTYHTNAVNFFAQWLPGEARNVPHTPLGLAFRYHWGSLRYAANTAFLCFVYAKMLPQTDPLSTRLFDYATHQINYLLGDSGRSWVVGFGERYPLLPYHKSSYNSILHYPLRGQPYWEQQEDFLNSPKANVHILYGALVGGPFPNDTWIDSRWDYEWTEVTQDYNAAFTGAIAALVEHYGGVPFTDESLDLGWNYPGADPKPVYRTMFSEMVHATTGTTGTTGAVTTGIATITTGIGTTGTVPASTVTDPASTTTDPATTNTELPPLTTSTEEDTSFTTALPLETQIVIQIEDSAACALAPLFIIEILLFSLWFF